ncbi:hypothetical protein AYJ54_10240 [Bradyrhizobium centrolobii]|uniref:FAD-binding domain-containing protein n=1 Tax=Bradyrhizobium centrolobii TaxID=1505087 RepID=A0A176YTV9_9BRAD|nr:hypothetical protein [Bradyrhizobium centrolobii]OAF10647.1 hypothetical protein AYJ54_10240 [Bradyrhizobium centrolobii]
MQNILGRRAVVIGSGIGGLSAAAVLVGYFEEVVILERDEIAPFIQSRPGTPQDRHPHGLLAGGLKTLDEILPGFRRGLAAAGAVSVNIAREIRIENPAIGAFPRRDFGLSLLFASRPLIEAVLRGRVLAFGNVSLWPRCRVVEIVEENRAVCGVRYDSGPARSQTLDCDLVVDASGRAGPTLLLLDALGWQRPEATEVRLEIGYSTAIVRFDARERPEWKVVVSEPNPPGSALKAVFVPLEGDRWYLTIADRRAVPRLESWDDFSEACSQLNMPTLSRLLRHAQPIETGRHFVFPGNRWNQFERLDTLPRGVLPIADSLCRLSPSYGQGMTSAVRQARLLLDALNGATAEPDPIAAAQAVFMRDVPAVIHAPWRMASGVDLAFPEARGKRPEHFEEHRRFQSMLVRAAVEDPVVHRAMVEVGQLLQPPTLFEEPHIRERIEMWSAKAAT